MGFEDRELSCVDCGTGFTFSAGEQERHAQLGFTNEPKRCAPCRSAKKAQRGGSGGSGGGGGFGGGQREMHAVVCAECGKSTEVPFKPRGDRPVYCSDCFAARR